ncbi:NAD(P)-binding protein, partial [Acinetobacter baumannii]
MPAILFTAYAGFPMLNAKQHAIQKTKIAIIGAGFGGLAMAIRLLQSQQSDFFILEKSNDVGGTWRENRYPGAACDVQSHMYSLSFAPKTDWSKRYADIGIKVDSLDPSSTIHDSLEWDIQQIISENVDPEKGLFIGQHYALAGYGP